MENLNQGFYFKDTEEAANTDGPNVNVEYINWTWTEQNPNWGLWR